MSEISFSLVGADNPRLQLRARLSPIAPNVMEAEHSGHDCKWKFAAASILGIGLVTRLCRSVTHVRTRKRESRLAGSTRSVSCSAHSQSVPFPTRIDAVLFDIDGTLADTDPIHFHTFVSMFQKVGYNNGEAISEEFFQHNISGRCNEVICKDLFPDWSTEQARAFSDEKEATFRRLAADKLQPLGGLLRLLDFCDSRSLRSAAVTNAPRLNAEFILECIGRRNWFQELVIGEECERPKPDPCPYLTAMARLGVRPEHCLVFEDSPSGAAAGVAAGVFTVGLATSRSEHVLKAAGCGMVISDFEDEGFWQLLSKV